MQIEKNVPIPPTKGATVGMTEKMRTMESGDSFLIAKKDRHGVHSQANNARIKIKTKLDKETGQVRVWRIG